MLDEAADWVAVGLGVALFVATSISMVKTLIVPRRAWSLLTSVVTRSLVWFFHSVAQRMRNEDLADRFLGFLGPVAVIGTTVALFASYAVSFALMLFGVSDDSAGRALREAGSSVTTLGFESTGGWGPTAVDVLAGVSGLVVIALTIAYLPTLYVILRDRETPVKLVAGRVGPPVTGVRVLTEHAAAGASDELADLQHVLGLEDAAPGSLSEATREELDEAASELRRAGCAVSAVDDGVVREWQRARDRYASALCQVADAIMAPGDPWTSAD